MDPSVLNIGVCSLIVGTVAVLSIRHDNMKNRRTKKAIERRRQLEVASIKDGANMVRREYEQEKKQNEFMGIIHSCICGKHNRIGSYRMGSV